VGPHHLPRKLGKAGFMQGQGLAPESGVAKERHAEQEQQQGIAAAQVADGSFGIEILFSQLGHPTE